MRPAFSSPRQAAAFALLLLVLLLSPVWAGKKLLPPREQAYATLGWGSGPYPWIRNQIFEETNDIDIAFVGSSHILHAVNTPYVQAQLSARLGRPAVVRTIGWGGAGYDGLYLISKNLFAHRRVHILVFYDENPASGQRFTPMTALFRFGADAPALAGLPIPDQSLFYFAAIVGMPRNLLCQFRPNIPIALAATPRNYWDQHYGSAFVGTLLGCTCSELGFNYDPLSDNFTAFTPFVPPTPAQPADVKVYSPETRNSFEFASAPLPAWQTHFARQMAQLAATNRCRLIMLHIPVLAEASETTLHERAFWPEIFGGNFRLVGIPPAKMFQGLNDQKLHWLYTNSGHFNKNGMAYFTALITPELLQLYEDRN